MWKRILFLFRRGRMAEELEEEMRLHITLRASKFHEQGLDLQEAAYAAQKQFGNRTLLGEVSREMWNWAFLESLFKDISYALRSFRKNPGFTASAVLTLALGIGANTAIFSVVDHVILRPLPFREPDRLYALQEAMPNHPGAPPVIPVNAKHFAEWRKDVAALDAAALLIGSHVDLTGAGEPQRLPIARVSWDLFQMLGIQPYLGRGFRAEEGEPGHDQEVIINNDVWRSRFGSDPNVIGRKIVLDGKPYQVIGVLPANFRFPKLAQLYGMHLSGDRPEMWEPLALTNEELNDSGSFNYACIARLKPGISSDRALPELNAVEAAFARELPGNVNLRAVLLPLQTQITARARLGLQIVLIAVGTVLLIACVNIANLLLSRSTVRSRELAIRAALGASRERLLRQLLVESVTLALAGGLLAMGIAYLAIHVLISRAPIDLPRLDEVQLDPQILLFTAAISIFCGLLFGLLPAWMSARRDPQEAMQGGGRGSTTSGANSHIRSILVGAEVCFSAVSLLLGALLLHSFVNLLNIDKGFSVQREVTADLSLPSVHYPDNGKRASFMKQLLERVEALPGITSAGIVNQLPLSGEGGNGSIQVEGSNLPPTQSPLADIRQVSPAYFRTMSIPLRRGTEFSNSDENRPVAVVSAGAARKLWPHEDPIGKRFRVGPPRNPMMQVLGVVGDIRGSDLSRPPSPTVYLPYWVRVGGDVTLVVRTELSAAAAYAEIRKSVHEMDSQMPVQKFQTMEDVLQESLSQRKFQMCLVLLFGVSALLLASLGIYGVVSYSVRQRTSEIGIRMALGALSSNVCGMVLRQGLTPVIAGLMVGLVVSFMVVRLIKSVLFGVSAVDTTAIIGVVLLLMIVAGCAALIAALRAARVDPAITLRYE